MKNKANEGQASPVAEKNGLLSNDANDLATQSIDISSLFGNNLEDAQSFDLRGIGSSSLGKLLDALPIPALMVNELHFVVFGNDACYSSSSLERNLYGMPFTDLVARSENPPKAHDMFRRTTAILEKAFATREPQRVEAVLQLGGKRIWGRLHFRSVRLASQKHVLILVEDMTLEKATQRLDQREGQRVRKQYRELSAQVMQLGERIKEAEEQLKGERVAHEETKGALRRAMERLKLQTVESENLAPPPAPRRQSTLAVMRT